VPAVRRDKDYVLGLRLGTSSRKVVPVPTTDSAVRVGLEQVAGHLGDGQAEPHAVPALLAGGGEGEGKEAGELVGWDAGAVVGDGKDTPAALAWLGGERDLAAGSPPVFDRVGQQVVEDQAEHVAIGFQRGVLVNVHGDLDGSLLRRRGDTAHDVLDQALHHQRGEARRVLAAAESVGVDEAVHRGDGVEHGAAHGFQVIGGLGEARLAGQLALEHLDHEQDPVHPAAQVMVEERDVVRLEVVGNW